jgi:DNA-binding transcriptional regulator YhcF (GntR family)
VLKRDPIVRHRYNRYPKVNLPVQLWFTRDGRVPLRDQLATQLMLAIASGELPAGKQLPTTRSLAKQYQLNVNTISAAYQKLEALGWVDSVHGSGVFVREAPGRPADSELADLDRLVLTFLRAARSAGLSAKAVRERVNHWLGNRPQRFVFVHSEKPLRLIVRKELQEALTMEIQECDCDSASIAAFAADSVLLTMHSKQSDVRDLAPPSAEVIPLRVR